METTNRNVPDSALILNDVSQCSGEIVTTTYSDSEGRIWRVTDWKSDKRHMVDIADVAAELGISPIKLYAKIVTAFMPQSTLAEFVSLYGVTA